jgi:pimeloyl-ACP methyl ester carboxylesterase
MREFYVDVRGGRLCVCEWGTPGQPLILCLHGICDQGAIWSPVAARLADEGYYVLAPDLLRWSLWVTRSVRLSLPCWSR